MSPQRNEEVELDLLVRRMTWEAEDVLSVELVRPDGGELPAWTPGAHLDLHVGAHVRQYSLCSDPADRRAYRIGVLREPSSRGGSAHVHERLRPGQTVRVRGPRNNFELSPAAPGYLFIAGGIGVTPILAMAREVAARDGVPVRLVHGGRRRASMAFGEELRELLGDRVEFVPEDERGRIDLDSLSAALDPGTEVYCCGPEPLLAAVEERFPGARTERFAAPSREGSEASAGEESGFEVVCARSERTVRVEAGCSVLRALEEAGIGVPSSCQDGICGTCETKVLEGAVDHRDFLLSDEEKAAGASMMVCVSRAAGDRLVLDV
ncbi:PDR/VanB family oxidoreductase [Phaeacidiphilus oryzae]|uniref:PDR/VanB family oxidoreductase n=1 Tax=Phaeacidiphilus oryzae TaxID=348818 RepID=UPI00056BBE0D|nr:PDR/VanB family oxidoreductase [Phaeacidiphilus oryzae]